MSGRIIENNILFISSTVDTKKLRRNLLPGEENSGLDYGYLHPRENLEEIVATDNNTLKEIGVTHDHIATAIEKLFACGSQDEFRGNPMIPIQYIHSPVCPWEDFCSIPPMSMVPQITEIILFNPSKIREAHKILENSGSNFQLKDYRTLAQQDIAMIFSDLHPHLIRKHHFFQGHHTPYRVDPLKAIEYLKIGK